MSPVKLIISPKTLIKIVITGFLSANCDNKKRRFSIFNCIDNCNKYFPQLICYLKNPTNHEVHFRSFATMLLTLQIDYL